KNDNARFEQKNGSHVRPLLGYDRFEDPDCIEDLNELLAMHACWANLFRPCMKLIAKVKEGHRYKKTHDRPQTLAQQVLAHPDLPPAVAERIKAMQQRHDCYTLKCQVHKRIHACFSPASC
ncbi:MAG: hypothetical protein O3B24_11115, partial [Verrucomicrobia bacterium]|nr:hypothetical protein [Verrucomicrobiota bacterium]